MTSKKRNNGGGEVPVLKVDLKEQIVGLGALEYSVCRIRDPVLTVERLESEGDHIINYYISVTFKLSIGAKQRKSDHRADYHQRYLRSINLDHEWAEGDIQGYPEQYPEQDDDPTFQVADERNTTMNATLGATGSSPNFSIFLSRGQKTTVQTVLKGWDYITPPDNTNLIWVWKTNYRTARRNPDKRVHGSLLSFQRHVMVRRRISINCGTRGGEVEDAASEDEDKNGSDTDLSVIERVLNTRFEFKVKIGVNERKGPIKRFFRQLCSFGFRASDGEYEEKEQTFYLAQTVDGNPLFSLLSSQIPRGETIDLPHTLREMTKASNLPHKDQQKHASAALGVETTGSVENHITVVDLSKQRE